MFSVARTSTSLTMQFTSGVGVIDHIYGLNSGQLSQPGHPFEGRHSGYQPKGGDAVQLGSEDRYGSCVDSR